MARQAVGVGFLVSGLVLAACSGDGNSDTTVAPAATVGPPVAATTTEPETTQPPATPTVEPAGPRFTYQAQVSRTDNNVPHITADDMGSLGFGYGYAFAEDHLCSLADVVVQVRGEAASFFGRGDNDRWLNQDLVYRAMNLYERAAVDFDNADADLQSMVSGYAAGYNRYLADIGGDFVPGYCSGAAWVRPIDEYDLAAYYKALSWRASVDPLLNYIATATPPANPETVIGEDGTAGVDESAFAALIPEPTEMASNAWAIGPDRTEDGTTMLVGNPHFPWQGALRFYEVHLTVPGELNVYGASLLGSPAVNIGFTEGVAWSHTVSAGRRFTAYTLTLEPSDPTRYLYDGEYREMTPAPVVVDVLEDDGTMGAVERTLWFSHYGPVINFPGLGWSNDLVLTFRDANADNDELIAQFAAINRATTMDELIQAHADHQGIPWVNTVAASADGRIWYADTSASPNLSDEAINAYEAAVTAGGLAAIAFDNGVILLDGSDPLYEWVDDPEARDPGVVPFGEMPQLERTDFVFNANDPYWFANPDELLSGFSPVHGLDRTPVSPRTRGNANQLSIDDGDAGDDGLFNRIEMRDSAVGNRAFTADMLLDDVVERCRAAIDDGLEAAICDVLDDWDGRFDLDSVGAGVWREFIATFSNADLLDAGALWANPFNPDNPLDTPNGLSDDPEIADRLVAAAETLRADGFDIDTPLGEMQYALRGDVRVPIHGGRGSEGVSNVVGGGGNGTTSERSSPRDQPGYPVSNGTSFIYNIEFTAGGPVAEGFLTYGESGDSTSDFFSDQTIRFSEKDWRPILFTEPAIAADPELSTYLVAG
jgi:acyl-homoserine-lactone acylase